MGKANGKLATLTRDNHEDWFRRAKLKIREKGAWLAVENAVEDYAWVKVAKKTSSTSTTTTDSSKITTESKDQIEELTNRFARQGGFWDIEKKKEFDQWDAKALGIMIDGLDRDDAVFVDEYETAAAVWTQLRVKYCKTDKSTARINMSEIQKFDFTDDSTIDSSWMRLKEYRRKIIAANKGYAAAYPDDVLFNVFTSALYKADRYTNVLDGFMTQNLSVEESLKILQEKESQIREIESMKDTSLAARQQRKQKFDPRNSISESDTEMENATLKCYCCGSKEHFVADCEYQAAANAYARKLRLKKEYSRKTRSNNKTKINKEVTRPKKKISIKRSKRGHAAVDYITSSEEGDTSESDSENIDDEVVALSKEDIRKDL